MVRTDLMDIFEHIMKEHREVESMLSRLSKGFDEATFNKLNTSLTAHMRAEEGSLYPAMKDQESEMIEHATDEHHEVDGVLGELGNLRGEEFKAKIGELTDMIADHVKEEEEEMIPKARTMFDRDTVKELSAKFDEVDNRISQKA